MNVYLHQIFLETPFNAESIKAIKTVFYKSVIAYIFCRNIPIDYKQQMNEPSAKLVQ